MVRITKMYYEENISMSKIGNKFNCSKTPIFRVLKELKSVA